MNKLSAILLLITMLVALFQCKEKPGELILKPKWNEGDVRHYEIHYSLLVKQNDDTVVHFDVEKNLQLVVVSKTKSGYVLEVSRPVPGHIEFNTIVDSMKVQYNGGFQFLESLSKYMHPYQIKVTDNGEVEEIVDLEEYFVDVLLTLTSVFDTANLTIDSIKMLQNIFPENTGSTSVEMMNQALLKETSDIFDIYNINNPMYGDVTQKAMIPFPGTGEERQVTMVWRTVSLSDHQHVIEMSFKIDTENLSSLLNDSANMSIDHTNALIDQMSNHTLYHLDPKTNWIDSMNMRVQYQTDSVEVDFRNHTHIVN